MVSQTFSPGAMLSEAEAIAEQCLERLKHTLRHEFGHVTDRRQGVTGSKWRNLVNQMKAQGFSPSKYAEINLEEYWIEAFAYYTATGYGTSTDSRHLLKHRYQNFFTFLLKHWA